MLFCISAINNNDNSRSQNNSNNSDSYLHLMTLKLASADAVNSCCELWLNPAGSLLFLRRHDQVILFTLSLMQIEANVWQFVHVAYEETETLGSDRVACKLAHSLNAARLLRREFEIQWGSPLDRQKGVISWRSKVFVSCTCQLLLSIENKKV